MRTELKLGLLVYAAAFGLNCFVPLPELVLGAASALGPAVHQPFALDLHTKHTFL